MFNRRHFLQTLAAATTGLMLRRATGHATTPPADAPPETDALGKRLPQRRFGRTGAWVTMLGLGGAHVGRQNERDAQATIETAIAGGVRYFDTAESYQNSEAFYGRFLTPKYRQHVFITTKTTASDAKTARAHLESSLQRMKIDTIDLWKIHSVRDTAEVDARLAQGVLDVFIEAKAKGRVRHIGFSGHYHPNTHKHLITLMAERNNPLETCLMPINVIDPKYLSFIETVLPLLVKHQYGVVAMKSLSDGGFFQPKTIAGLDKPISVVPDRVSVREAVHFVWSLPVSVLISGPSNPEEFQQMIGFAREFEAMDENRRLALIERAADCAGTAVESYKSRGG